MALVLALGAATSLVRAETFVATVPVPYPNSFGVAVDPGMQRVYVGHYYDNKVSVIDVSLPLGPFPVIADVPVGDTPYGVAVDPVTHFVYVANAGSDSVTVIDGSQVTPSVMTTIANPGPSNPAGVAVDPVTHRVYVAEQFYGQGQGTYVWVIDGLANPPTPVAYVNVGITQPYGVAVDPVLQRVYVTHFGSTTLSVIDTSGYLTNTFTVLAPVTLPFNGYFIAVDSVLQHHVYVTHQFANKVTVLAGTQFGTFFYGIVAVSCAPYGIGIDPVTARVYVTHLRVTHPACPGAGLVTVIAGSFVGMGPPPVVASFSVNGEPRGVAAAAGRIYVTSHGVNPSVTVFSYP